MASISFSDHRLPMSKRRLKPLILRDYLLDDLSSCSSNGFKSFPRRLLDAEIKRSGIFHYNRRLTCGLAFCHAVQKASTVILSAVKLLPFPTSVNSPSGKKDIIKKGGFSRSFSKRLLSRSFWKKPSRRELNAGKEIEFKTENHKQENQHCKSFADFLQESLDQPSDRIDSLFSGEESFSNAAGDSSSFRTEFFTNSELTQSSTVESETSNENNAVENVTETTNGEFMISGDCVGSHVSDNSSVNYNKEEFVNEEKEQFSPISILECSFEDDAITPHSYQKEKLLRKRRRFESLVQLKPKDLEKLIEHVESQDHNSTEEDQSENGPNRLFSLVKSNLIEEPNYFLDNLLLDFFKENEKNLTKNDDKLVKIVEEWVMRKYEEESMFMSWEIKEKREIYVKEMKWDFMNGDQKEFVIDELENGFVTFLIDEFILDLSNL